MVVQHVPVPLTCGVFDGTIITDPSLLEEELLTTHVTVVSTAEGQVSAESNPFYCCVHKVIKLGTPGRNAQRGPVVCFQTIWILAVFCAANHAALNASILRRSFMAPRCSIALYQEFKFHRRRILFPPVLVGPSWTHSTDECLLVPLGRCAEFTSLGEAAHQENSSMNVCNSARSMPNDC